VEIEAMIADRLREFAESIGKPGIVGLALTAFAATFWVSSVRPLLDERDVLRDAAVKVERRRLATDAARPEGGTPAEQLANFYAFFPVPSTAPDWLAKISRAARANGLQLASGEYRLTRSATAALLRYQVVLPVQGSYPQVRAFVDAILADVPAAVVEEISIKRESVESPRVDARIRLTLYLGVSA
jgi:hypothetical protein